MRDEWQQIRVVINPSLPAGAVLFMPPVEFVSFALTAEGKIEATFRVPSLDSIGLIENVKET